MSIFLNLHIHVMISQTYINLHICIYIYIYVCMYVCICIYNFEIFLFGLVVRLVTYWLNQRPNLYTESTSGLGLITKVICNKILYFDFSDDIGGSRKLMGGRKGDFTYEIVKQVYAHRCIVFPYAFIIFRALICTAFCSFWFKIIKITTTKGKNEK